MRTTSGFSRGNGDASPTSQQLTLINEFQQREFRREAYEAKLMRDKRERKENQETPGRARGRKWECCYPSSQLILSSPKLSYLALLQLETPILRMSRAFFDPSLPFRHSQGVTENLLVKRGKVPSQQYRKSQTHLLFLIIRVITGIRIRRIRILRLFDGLLDSHRGFGWGWGLREKVGRFGKKVG